MAQGMNVQYSITRLPPWAQATISPATDHPNGDLCQGGQLTLRTFLSVSVTDQAPAFAPDSVELAASVTDSAHAVGTGRTSFPIAASYFSILDVSSPIATIGVPPSQSGVVPILITNLGNANTKVTFTIESPANDFSVRVPVPVLLESKQSGGTQASRTVPIEIYRTERVDSTSETVTVKWSSAYALDPKVIGDSGKFSFVVTSAEGSAQPQEPPVNKLKDVPGPALPLVLVALVAIGVALRRAAR
jgi:hypothetical protein